MTMRRFMIGMVGATVLLVGAVGCSSDDGDSSSADTSAATTETTASTGTTDATTDTTGGTGSTTPSDPATAEFVTRANAVCAAGNEEINQTLTEVYADPPPSAAALQDGVDAIVTGTRDMADQIEELDVPASIQDDVDAMLEALRAGADDVEAQGTSFFDDQTNAFADAADLATELGLNQCSGS